MIMSRKKGAKMGCGLRREVESMLDLVVGVRQDTLQLQLYSRPFHAFGSDFTYDITMPENSHMSAVLCTGHGSSKREALENLLSRWRSGEADLPCPAQSREELKIKIDLLRDGTD